MHTDMTPVTDLGLPTHVVERLTQQKIGVYAQLCCATLGDLEQTGLSKDEIGSIVELVKKNSCRPSRQ